MTTRVAALHNSRDIIPLEKTRAALQAVVKLLEGIEAECSHGASREFVEETIGDMRDRIQCVERIAEECHDNEQPPELEAIYARYDALRGVE